MKRIFEFLIHSNLLISIAAVSLTLQTQLIFDVNSGLHPYLFIVFFATLFEYNLHRLFTLIYAKEALSLEKHYWLNKHLKTFYIIMAVSTIGFVIAAINAKPSVLEGLAPLAVLTLFYSIPFIRLKNKLYKLRDIPFFKTFLIALIWSVSTVMLPIWQSELSPNKLELFYLLAERFLFVFAICIPFDIRDIESDRSSGLKTFPIIMGEKKSYNVAMICMAAILPIAILHYLHQPEILIPMLISILFGLYILGSKTVRNVKNYHYGILDGSMIFQSLIVYLSYLIAF